MKEQNKPENKKKRKITAVSALPKSPKPVVKTDKLKESKLKEVKVTEKVTKPSSWSLSKTIILVLLVALLIVLVTNCIKTQSVTNTAVVETKATETTAVKTTDAIAKANQILLEAGWKSGDYVVGSAIDLSKDKSTAGNGALTKKGIKTTTGMLLFLKSDEATAKALLNQIKKKTDATTAEVMNDQNWVAVQSLVAFTYPGNTTYRDGNVVGAGLRKGKVGDIFFIFISPSTTSASGSIFVRGGCANPQTVVPIPKTTTTITTTETATTVPATTTTETATTVPVTTTTETATTVPATTTTETATTVPATTTPPTTIQPKDPTQDPAAQGNAPIGGGTNQDLGSGEYIDPSKMEQPPNTAYVAPDVPETTVAPTEATPDTTPPPPPETLAPTPDAPADEYSPPPGM